MSWRRALLAALVCGGVGTTAGFGQGAGGSPSSERPVSRTFQLTLVIESPQSGAAAAQPPAESITTEIVVPGEGRMGYGKARMTSQLPTSSQAGAKLVELGTKLDVGEVHVDGKELALHFVLETSRLTGFVSSKDDKGAVVEEPLITERTVELSVKLPLDRAKVVFDSKAVMKPVPEPGMKGEMKPLPEAGGGTPGLTVRRLGQTELRVEMVATEVK